MAAPIAQMDDEWENFASFSTSDDAWLQNCSVVQENFANSNGYATICMTDSNDNLENLQISDSFAYDSMEDLVHSFDEKLASCFRITEKDAEKNSTLSHLSAVSLDTYSQDPTWKRLTENYGLVQPLNWNTSQIKKLHIPSLCLPFHEDKNGKKEQAFCKIYQNADDDIQNQMDYHHMIEYNVYSEISSVYDSEMTPGGSQGNSLMQTADEVIEELEEIMKDADDFNAALDYEVQDETGIVFNEELTPEHLNKQFEKPLTCRQSLGSLSSIEESERALELKSKTIEELNIDNEELENQVRSLSSELLEELNKRDELQYEIEIKHSFISKVLEVQYKRDEIAKLTSTTKKFSALRKSVVADSIPNGQGKYLTTVIPCSKGFVPTIDNLQSLNKILDAMKVDSDEVPSLLTSYILQVVCPAPSECHVLRL